MGYIKDVTQARKCALYEAKELASQYGYKDDEKSEKFIKEDGEMSSYDVGNYEHDMGGGIQHSGKKMSHQNEESREVEIGNEIIKLGNQIQSQGYDQHSMGQIISLGHELIKMHSGKS